MCVHTHTLNMQISFKDILFYACMHACMYVHHMHVWKSLRSEEGIEVPETGVSDNREPSYSCWNQNLGLLHEQQILLSIEPCPRLKGFIIFI